MRHQADMEWEGAGGGGHGGPRASRLGSSAAACSEGGYFDLKPRWASAAFTQSLMEMVSKGTASRPGYFFSK